jgi:single-stranded-DNA-specific exonuclease
MFPEPLFDGRFRLLQQRLVGERHLKVMVEPVGGGPLLDGIAFNVDTSLWPDNGVREVSLPISWISMSSAATAACS